MGKKASYTENSSDPWAAMDAAELRSFLQMAAKLWLAHDGLWFQAVSVKN